MPKRNTSIKNVRKTPSSKIDRFLRPQEDPRERLVRDSTFVRRCWRIVTGVFFLVWSFCYFWMMINAKVLQRRTRRYAHQSRAWRATAATSVQLLEETSSVFGLSGVKCARGKFKEKRQRPPRLEWAPRVCTANKRWNYTLLNDGQSETVCARARARRWSIFEGGCAEEESPLNKTYLPAGMSRSLSRSLLRLSAFSILAF